MGSDQFLTINAQIYTGLWTIFFTAFIFYFGIFDYSSESHWASALQALLMTGQLSCLVGILKFCTTCYDLRKGIEREEGFKRDYLIGCGAALLFTIIPSILCFFAKISFETQCSVFFAFNVASMVLYFPFFWRFDKMYQVEHTNKIFFIVVAFYFIHALILVSFTNYFIDKFHIWATIAYYLPRCYYAATLLEVSMGRFKKRIEDTEMKRVDIQGKNKSEAAVETGITWIKVDEFSKEETNSLAAGATCDICFMAFDESIPKQTPRILIECGHTVCEGCIENLLKQNENHYVVCPFCQQSTVIHGRFANELPKNYGVLKLIR